MFLEQGRRFHIHDLRGALRETNQNRSGFYSKNEPEGGAQIVFYLAMQDKNNKNAKMHLRQGKSIVLALATSCGRRFWT